MKKNNEVQKLRVRKMPFDFKAGFKGMDFQALLKNLSQFPGGLPYALYSISGSLFVEAGEQQIFYMHDKMHGYSNNESAVTFVKQELQHSIYHKVVNSIVEPKYVVREIGPKSLNYRVYPLFSPDEVFFHNASKAKTQEERNQALKMIFIEMAAFETSLGILQAIAHFNVWGKVLDDLININPFWTYLWLYHFTEEAEHVHTSFDTFESAFNETLWSKENFQVCELAMNRFKEKNLMVAMELARDYKIKVSVMDMMQTPLVQEAGRLKTQHLKVGFDIDSLRGERERIIHSFDNEWEPKIREKCIEWIGKEKVAA